VQVLPFLVVAVAAAAFAAGWWLARSQDRAMKDAFAALSAEVLRNNSVSFLQLAKTSLDQARQGVSADLDARHKEISALVEPVKQTLDKLDVQLRDSGKDQATLRGQLLAVSQTQDQLQKQTQTLVNALKSPNQRGRWGEVQLRNVLERAGMAEFCGDFTEKAAVLDDMGRRAIPDVTIRLPNGACIVIDSKVPIDAYLNAVDAPDESRRTALLKDHARQVREHIKGLASKTYWAKFTPTPELVVMFLPGEPLFSTALQHDSTLFDYAADQRVIPASPLTLLALLRTVASAWQQQRLAQSAEEVRALGTELYERLAVMAENIQSVGMNLRQAGAAYDRFIGSIESRVLVTARRFKDLGVSAAKDLPELEPVRIELRETRAPELRAPVQESLIQEVDSSQFAVNSSEK
jgi:DNA recombination protein RmuC